MKKVIKCLFILLFSATLITGCEESIGSVGNFMVQKSGEKIISANLSHGELEELLSSVEFSLIRSSKPPQIEDVTAISPIEMLRKVQVPQEIKEQYPYQPYHNYHDDVYYYSKHSNEKDCVFIFYTETLIPDYALDYTGSVRESTDDDLILDEDGNIPNDLTEEEKADSQLSATEEQFYRSLIVPEDIDG